MDEAVGAREELHESTKLHHLAHKALVDAVHLGLAGEVLDDLPRAVAVFLADSGDADGAVVADVDLGVGLLHDVANDLAARPDDVPDLVGVDAPVSYTHLSKFSTVTASRKHSPSPVSQSALLRTEGLTRA